MNEIKAIGIQPGNIIKWTVNRRLKRVWGRCIQNRNKECEIQIAARLLEDDRISEEACKNTIIHEILHSCPECSDGHRGRWKEYAERMNAKYGYSIKRTTSGEEKGVEAYEPTRQAVKYIYECSGCKQKIQYKRKCKFTRRYRSYMCTRCGTIGGFIRIQ